MLIASAAKGLEIGTNLRMSQVIAEEIDEQLHHNICVLSGPNLAREILMGLPAATIAAAEDEDVSRMMQRLLTTPNLCVFTHTDVIGVELGGALKNIIALGAGMADGLGYGDNAKAAFMTRGLTEISALGVALGANPLTFSGLAGLGDLIATCSSTLSRNHYMGVELTKGRSVEEITGSMEGVAEGVSTTKVAWNLARQLGLEMPITEKIYRVLYEGLSPKEAAAELMGAQVNHELTGRKVEIAFFSQSPKASLKPSIQPFHFSGGGMFVGVKVSASSFKSLRCLSFSESGVTTTSRTSWSPRPPLLRWAIPCPLRRKSLPVWLPGGILILVLPARLGTSTSSPRAAWTKLTGSS